MRAKATFHATKQFIASNAVPLVFAFIGLAIVTVCAFSIKGTNFLVRFCESTVQKKLVGAADRLTALVTAAVRP